jgi:hypothetical protein
LLGQTEADRNVGQGLRGQRKFSRCFARHLVERIVVVGHGNHPAALSRFTSRSAASLSARNSFFSAATSRASGHRCPDHARLGLFDFAPDIARPSGVDTDRIASFLGGPIFCATRPNLLAGIAAPSWTKSPANNWLGNLPGTRIEVTQSR